MLGSTILTVFLCVLVFAQDPLLSIEKQITPWNAAKVQKKMGCKSALPGYFSTTECLANFISDQLQIKGTPNFALAPTFRVGWDYVPPQVPNGQYPNTTGADLADRADIYDNAMSVIFLLNEGLIDPAKKISDTLVLILDNEPLSDGRMEESFSVASPINRKNYGTTILASFSPNANDDTIDTGDMAFVAIALSRMFVHTGEYKYLKAAVKIGGFLQNQFISSSGYSQVAGGDYATDWRATVHNIAIYSLADNLYGITRDKQWLTMQQNAEQFIAKMFDPSIGAYRYGYTTATTDEWITKTVSGHSQSFKLLSGVDDSEDRNNQAMQWIINHLITHDSAPDDVTGEVYRYMGLLHAEGGSGIDSETTAAAAIALSLQANKIQSWNPTLAKSFQDTSENLISSLLQMQKYAPFSDGQGIVATPNPGGALMWAGNEFTGETYRYFPLLHTAATAWTGIAIEVLKHGDLYANPFSSYYKKSNKKYYGSSVFASGTAIKPIALDTSRPLNIVALIAAGLIGALLVTGTVVLLLTNIRLYNKGKQLEHESMPTVMFERLPTSTPASPGLVGTPVDTNNPQTMYASPLTPSQQQPEQSLLHQ